MMVNNQNCVFCNIIAGDIPSSIIVQTDHVIVIQDITPKAPIHYLIIPKKHIQDLVSSEQADAMILSDMLLIPKLLVDRLNNPTLAFKLIVNNGYDAGQRVFHLHFHFLAGKTFSD